MSKKTAILLLAIFLLSFLATFASCTTACEHSFTNGVCSKCGQSQPPCKHEYANGVCSKCGQADPDYVAPCEHNYVKGVCSKCGQADPNYVPCAHSFVKGACVKCGEADPSYQPVYYRNPILAMDCADPHIIEHEGAYYIFSTGLNISKSVDCVHWERVGNMGISPNWGTSGAGNWAPDVIKLGNKFLVYYSRSTWGDANPGVGVASADHPLGPWTDHGCLFLSKEIGVDNSIDPGAFVGQDGKVYLVWGSFRGIFGVQLSDDGLSLYNGLDYAKENKVLLAGKVGEWDGATFEGAYVIYKDGYYYLFGSSGNCCDGLKSTYNVRVGRSRNPLGPYEDSKGNSMVGRNVGHQVIQGSATLVGPGHNSILIDDAGDYWLVYHVWQDVDGVGKGRYLAIDQLIWDKDGWCAVKNAMPSSKKTVGPYIVTNGAQ